MKITLREIALLLGGTIVGNDDVIIENIRPIEEAGQGDITFICQCEVFKTVENN